MRSRAVPSVRGVTLPVSALGLPILFAVSSCSSFSGISPEAHVVAAPISERANTVLRECVQEYASADGRWGGCMSPGCTPIWATQFGYRAGVRREREDVIAVGRATAERASSELRGLFVKGLFGRVDPDDPAVLGFPAMAVSGSLGGRGIDATIFARGLARVDELTDPAARESAGLAVLLAEATRLQPEQAKAHLTKARRFAAGAKGGGDGAYSFLAWAAIAQASGDPDDLRRARDAEAATPYRFDAASSGALAPLENHQEMLSAHLAMVHALCDYAQAARDAAARHRAMALLDHVFSDAYFNGRFLIHDRLTGAPSKDVCSGCNFMALYLVDRLYGDAFVIDPVPALPERDWPDKTIRRGWDHTLVLEPGREGKPGAAEFPLAPLPPEGRILIRHAKLDAWTKLEYEVLSAEGLAPRGGIRLKYQPRGSDGEFRRNTYTFHEPFDETGVARIDEHGFWPLVFAATFTRAKDGTLSAVIRALEGTP